MGIVINWEENMPLVLFHSFRKIFEKFSAFLDENNIYSIPNTICIALSAPK